MIGVTVLSPAFVTYALAPLGVMAIAIGVLPTEIGAPAVFVLSLIAPGNFVAMGAEVVEGAARPGHGEAETFFGAITSGGVLGALVKSHADVGAEGNLDIDRMFGSKRV